MTKNPDGQKAPKKPGKKAVPKPDPEAGSSTAGDFSLDDVIAFVRHFTEAEAAAAFAKYAELYDAM